MFRRFLAALMFVGGAAVIPSSPASAASSHEANLAAIIVADHNDARAAAGLEPLSVLEPLAGYTEVNSSNMASSGTLGQTDLNRVMADFEGATWAGENTAVMFEPATEATTLWLASTPHAETILAPYATHIFASVSCSTDGRLWATVMLMENIAAPTVGPSPPESTAPSAARCARPIEPFRSSPDFVAQQYRDFLGREPESAGIDYWVAEMENGRIEPTQLMAAFMNSAEFGGRIAPIVRIHIVGTGEVPKAAALRSSLAEADSGVGLSQIAARVLASPAGAATYGQLDDASFVAELHRQLFGRMPTAAEQADGAQQLANGLTRGALVADLANASEYRERSYAEVQVYMAYAAMLLRSPDSEGLQYWIGIVQDGGSIEALLDGFISSSEYRNRF